MKALVLMSWFMTVCSLVADEKRGWLEEHFRNIYAAVLEREDGSSEFGVDAILRGRLRNDSFKALNLRADWKRLHDGQRVVVFEGNDDKIQTVIYLQKNENDEKFTLGLSGREYTFTLEELKRMFESTNQRRNVAQPK